MCDFAWYGSVWGSFRNSHQSGGKFYRFPALSVSQKDKFFYGSATRSIAFSLINGSGNTKLNYAVAVLDGIISRIGTAALLGFALKMGCQRFWYGDALAEFIPIVIGMCYYFFQYVKGAYTCV